MPSQFHARRVCAAALCGLFVPVLGWSAVVFDSGGFEGYGLGPIAGQFGWWGAGLAFGPGPLPGDDPQIVTLADGNRVLKLRVPDSQGAYSGVTVQWTPPEPPENNPVTVEFDIRRTRDMWVSNLWWNWMMPTGDQPGGLQWDSGTGNSVTLPFGFGGPGTPTVYGRFAHLSMTWDFVVGQAWATYDGVPLGPFAFSPTALPRGFEIDLLHDEATGRGPDTVYIDNFRVTTVPEPAAGWALILSGLARRRARGGRAIPPATRW